MTDCPPGSEQPPDRSWEDLLEDFDSLSTAFGDEAAANRERRAQARDPTDEFESDLRLPTVDFDPEAYLLVPHDSQKPQRPVPRRPEGPPPLRSDAVTVTRSGEGAPVESLESGTTYDVTCTLRNLGGFDADSVTVELFAEHRGEIAAVDTNAGTNEVQLHPNPSQRDGGQVPLSGYTTLSPRTEGLEVSLFRSDYSGDVPPVSSFIDTRMLPIADDRTFSFADFTGWTVYRNLDLQAGDDFEVWVTPALYGGRVHITTPGRPGGDYRNAYSSLNLQRALTVVPGTYTTNPSNERQPLDLTSTVGNSATNHVGTTAASVPPTGRTTASFTYSPEPPGSGDTRALTALYVRAYAPGLDEMPADWGALDHTASRFVGRWEGRWE